MELFFAHKPLAMQNNRIVVESYHKLIRRDGRNRKTVGITGFFGFFCHGANHFSLSSLAEQENAHDDKTQILLIDFTYFTRFSASLRKKIDLKGRTLQGLSRKS